MPETPYGPAMPEQGPPPIPYATTPPPAWTPPAPFPPPYPPQFPPPVKRRSALPWVLGVVALVVVVGAAVAVPLALRTSEPATGTIVTPTPSETAPWSGPLLAEEIFPAELQLQDIDTGDVHDFELGESWTHQDDCPATGRNKTTKDYLADCETRVEGYYESDDGDHQASFQVFAFPRDEELPTDKAWDVPDDFKVSWKAEAEMPSGYWWRVDTVGPFLILTQCGPTGVWRGDAEEDVAQRLTEAASDRIADAVKEALFW